MYFYSKVLRKTITTTFGHFKYVFKINNDQTSECLYEKNLVSVKQKKRGNYWMQLRAHILSLIITKI